ncbi:MAG: phospholipase D-like domain-containing protein [Polaribacter sp.]|uniref:phospholipase D-like domain-containing protein n=1 Tax=Polaribacter sp. TaxID=1920175 RepID=UPI002F358782
MDIINPNEIGVKISTLISESKEKFYAVTPYINIFYWKKIVISLQKAKERGVKIKFFYREIKDKDLSFLNELGVELYKIEGLHTKLYINEKAIIVSSMNLIESSDLYSIDFALHIHQKENYSKIYEYYSNYINQNKSSVLKKKYTIKDAFSSEESNNLKSGDLVHHNRFGLGEIKEKEGDGPNTKIIIKFDLGTKKLLLQFCNLKKISFD